MRKSDRFHKWVEWSEKDEVYIGRCPDLITGIHGDDPVVLYGELCDLLDETIAEMEEAGEEIPEAKTYPVTDEPRREAA